MGNQGQEIIMLLTVAISQAYSFFFRKGKELKPESVFFIITSCPTIVYIIWFFNGWSIYPVWAFYNPVFFALIFIAIAIAPQIAGIVEAFFNWAKYGERPFSKEHLCYASKWGMLTEGGYRGGRFQLELKHVWFSIVANISGALCSIALMLFARTLDGFAMFIEGTFWGDTFAACLSIGLFIPLQHNSGQQHQPVPSSTESVEENPENYRLDRVHVILNTFHLTINIAYCLATVVCVIIFLIGHFQKMPLSPMIILPLLAVIFFLYYANASEAVAEYKPISYGNWLVGPILASIVVVGMSVFFNFTYVHVLIIIIVVFLNIFRVVVKNKWEKREKQEANKVSVWFPVTMFIVFAVLVFAYIHGQ